LAALPITESFLALPQINLDPFLRVAYPPPASNETDFVRTQMSLRGKEANSKIQFTFYFKVTWTEKKHFSNLRSRRNKSFGFN